MTNPFTKGYCDVTFVDSLFMAVALIGLIGLGIVVYAVWDIYVRR